MSGARVSHSAPHNPFPGPQPYRAADRGYFFGREELTKKLAHRLMAHPCTTVFGPSGAGKSSLMQAGVIPLLEEAHDFRVVSVDGWPPGEAPLSWLVRAVFDDLELGDAPEGTARIEALDEAVSLAERRSERPILIYLDQLEQLLFPGRDAGEASALIEAVDRLAQKPIRGLQIALSLREDYLGRFRDRARGRRELLEHGFRLGPLSVGEMIRAVCRAAEEGRPRQRWAEEQVRALMLEVRVPGASASEDAEVQAAFGQIVCRALWEERAAGRGGEAGAVEAEAIVHRYLEATVEGLGALSEAARRLLEEHLIDGEGHRTLLTEQEARGVLPAGAAAEVLGQLERAAVLRAEEHQGSRYFELGHDWLASRVFPRRRQREQQKAERKRREAEAQRVARERAARRALGAIAAAAVAVAVAAVMAILVIWALRQRDVAEAAQREAADQAARARTSLLMAGARELLAKGQPAPAAKLLLEVADPGKVRGWTEVARDVLSLVSLVTIRGHQGPVVFARFSPDDRRIITASYDGTARVWNADGSGTPVVLRGHEDRVESAVFIADGQRVVTASWDKTARVWNADGSGTPVVLKGHSEPVRSAVFIADGQRVVTASWDKTARVWNADGSGTPVVLKGHSEPVRSAVFSADGQRVVTASWDKTARVWNADGSGTPVVLRGHEDRVESAVFSADGRRVVTASWDKTARVWNADGSGTPVVLRGHEDRVESAVFSADGQRVVTASGDTTARVWNANGSGTPVVLRGHEDRVESAVFSADGQRVVTASGDTTARVWNANGSGTPVVRKGHSEPVLSAMFSADGQRVVTASSDGTARVWNADGTMPVDASSVGTNLRRSLRFATTDCLSPEMRRTYLNESDESARREYEYCERSYDRTPFYP
ncbi:nSTAND1 domain-containing NTPase [Sorangium sp. So ce542]|uniref:nSTAND1 domain-containing NTPase n=1 Tax=Sorangium sp. So ce542 TaxID=3133316 RepID=UPI003F63BB2D